MLRKSICRWALVLLATGLWRMGADVSAAASEDNADPTIHLQVFSAVDRTVAAVGTSFAFHVEILATPATEDAAGDVEQAFYVATFIKGFDGLELVRTEPVVIREERSETGELVLYLSQRFLFRTWQPGEVTVPVWEMRCNGRSYSSFPHVVHIYQFSPSIFEFQRAILPIAVVNKTLSGRHTFIRSGTAFLIAPDAALTSFHTLIGADEVHITLPNDRRLTIDRVWAIDPVRDIVVLYIDPEETKQAGIVPLRLAPVPDKSTEQVDRTHGPSVVFTNGWSMGGQRSTAGVHYRDLTLRPQETIWVTNNPVRPGDSGGPLLDRHGRVLGVVTAGTVSRPRQNMLAEEMCIATNPRPVLWKKMVIDRPRSLRSIYNDPVFSELPHVKLLRLATLLAMGRRNFPDLDQILADLDTSIEKGNVTDAGLYYMQGSIYETLGTKPAAANAYLTALDVFEGHFPAAFMLANLYLSRHNYREAERLFSHTLTFKPYKHLATYGLAQTSMGQLRYEEAAGHLQRVLHFDPTFSPALYRLALCHYALGEKERSRQLLIKLEATDVYWAWRLHQVLNNPALRPIVLKALPRVSIDIIGR